MHQFSGVTEIVHDSLGHSDCLGSGYIMRRAAVEEIGGFPTESLSEDVCCSARLLGAGWKTCFIPESLQHGSVPESYNAHVKQRTRWVSGLSWNEYICMTVTDIDDLVRRPCSNSHHVQIPLVWRSWQTLDMAPKSRRYQLRPEALDTGSPRTHLPRIAIHPPLWLSFCLVVGHAATQDPDPVGLRTHAVSLGSPDGSGTHRQPGQQAVRRPPALVRHGS